MELVQYDADFGSLESNQASGIKSFTVTLDSRQMQYINKYREAGYELWTRIVSVSGAYGNAYSYSVTSDTLNSGGNTIKVTSNAMNLSNGSHTLNVRFMIAIIAEIK